MKAVENESQIRRMFVHVYSGDYGLFWRPNGHGYTNDKRDAWVARFEEVKHLIGKSYRDKYIELRPAAPEYEI